MASQTTLGAHAQPKAANMSTNNRKSNQNIQVYLRVRPTNERERLIRSIEMVEVPSHRDVLVKQTYETKTSKKFTFDRAFGPESRQTEVYQSVVAPLIEEVLAGYNCTVFAYGQTGTGKTHTMVGDEIPTMESSWEDDSQLGIIPRSLSHLFEELRLMGVEFSMRVSYLELYNEELFDLLSPSDTTQIRIFDDANKKGSIIVQGLEEITVHTSGDVYKLLSKGQENRRMASTLMNAHSSRSHTIFSITVHIRENGIDGEELLKIGKLNLVDLAGSENLSKAGNEKGIRTRETVNINQSLLTLGRVITALVERTPHIPYRESKLTRLLQESLGGRTKTSIIATISPGHKDLEETLSTLEYAHRAKNIQNRPEVNQKLTKRTVLKEYTEEIDRLKRDLLATRDKNGIYLAEETYQEMNFRIDSQNKDINEKMSLIKALKDEAANKQRIFTEVSLNLVEKAAELETAQGRLAVTAEELDQTKSVLRTTKRRYQEKKHLLESHVHTEERLTGQATALIGVADAASADTYRLHDTIERRRSVDAKIRAATEAHAHDMNVQLQQFTALQQQAVDKCAKQRRAQQDELANCMAQSSQFTAGALLSLKRSSETDRTSAASVRTCVAGNATALVAGCAAHKTTCGTNAGSMHGSVYGHLQNTDEQLGKLSAAVSQQASQHVENCAKLVQLTETAAAATTTFCEKRCHEAHQLMPIVRQLVKINEDNNTQLRNKIDQNGIRMRAMQAHMQQMFAQMNQLTEQMQQIEETNIAYSEHLDENASNIQALLSTIEKDNSATVDQTATYATEFGATAIEQKASLEQQNVAVVATCDAHIEHIRQLLDANARTRVVLDESLAETQALLQTHETDTVNRIRRLESEIEQLQLANGETASAERETLVAEVQAESQRQGNTNSVCVSLNDAIERDLVEYAQRVDEHVAECRGSIERFHRSELQTYRSTGNTPAKREFVYSKQLAQTSPHDRLVRRFWGANDNAAVADLDCSVTICEGNESAFLDGITDEKSSSILLQARSNALPTLTVSGAMPAVNEQRGSCDTSGFGSNSDNNAAELGVRAIRPRSTSKSPTPKQRLSQSSSAGGCGAVDPLKSPHGRLNRSAECNATRVGKSVSPSCYSENNKENVR